MSGEHIHVFAGDCTVTYTDAAETREERGAVVAVAKPDNTLLIHDRSGFRPIAWLTGAERLTHEADAEGFSIEAADGSQRLRVVSHGPGTVERHRVTHAGDPIGTCPECDGALLHAGDAVTCSGCTIRYGLPAGAEVLDEACADCGLPRLRVERGRRFEVCLDRECDPFDAHVREAFDRAWSCPECGDDLRVIRRGRLLVGCDDYPSCETAFRLPAGTLDGSCECGLPTFETPAGRRCLDVGCPGPA